MTNKNAPKALPKDFWETIEAHLPGYYSRQDVAENNDLAVLAEGRPTKSVLAALDKSNRKLYAEALEARTHAHKD